MPEISYTLHRSQFYIGKNPKLVDENWISHTLPNGLILSYSNVLPVKFINSNNNHFVLIGYAVQSVDTLPSPVEGLKQLSNFNNLQDLYRSWSGRWVILANNELHLDATAMLGCFYMINEEGIVVSSSAGLITNNFIPDTFKLVKKVGADYFPLPDSGFANLKKLMPTQILNIETGELQFRNLQYEAPQLSYDETIAMAAQLLKTILKNAYAEHNDKNWKLALTGGNDSRILLATLMACDIPFEIFTFDYPNINPFDVKLPRRLAKITGKKYKLIKRKGWNKENWERYNIHTAGHSVENDRDYMAWQQFDQFDGDKTFLLRGNCFEISRRYYHKWLPDNILNGIQISTTQKGNEMQGRSWQKWVDWAMQTPQVTMDWRERYFIEQRLAGWHSSTEQALDLINIDRLVPANSFLFYNIHFNIPEEIRKTKAPVIDLIKLLYAPLLEVPINPPLGYIYKQYRRVLFKVQKVKRKYQLSTMLSTSSFTLSEIVESVCLESLVI